jgi:FkbM family methyltransferase
MYCYVKPVGLGSFLRLYIGLLSSLVMVTVMRGRFKSTGHLTPGRSKLRVATAGVIAEVTPGNNSLALLAGVHEPKTTTWFDVKPGEIVLDLGAHIGRYTLIAAKHASRVVSIEPDPYNFAMLKSNVKLNHFWNVVALQLAISNSSGKRRFFLAGGGDTGTSSLESDWDWTLDAGIKRGEIDVECETLDRLIFSLGLERIDWLKIDVEGHEIAVLEGARIALSRTRKLILEVAEGNETTCRELVRRAGFEMISIDQRKKERGVRGSNNWFLLRTEDWSTKVDRVPEMA